MKIAILSEIYPASVLPRSEVERYGLRKRYDHTGIHNLVETLVMNGENQVHLISMCNEFKSDFSYERKGVVYDFIKPGGSIARTLTHFETDRLHIHRFLKREKFDIVHGQGLQTPGYFAATSCLPHVVTIHVYCAFLREMIRIHLGGRSSIPSLYFGALRIRRELWTLKRTRNFICSSQLIADAITRKGGCSANLFTVDNAISRRFFESNSDTDEDFALFVGSIQDRKSLLELLQALRMTKDIKLKIISGTSSGEYYQTVLRYIREANLADRVSLLGSKRNDEVVDVLRRAAFLVLPSKKEGAPIVIGEAMAAGKPVIATRVDGVPNMILDGETGLLVEPVDVEQLANKMGTLFSDKPLRLQMGIRARQEALRRWHPQVVAERTLDVYRNVIERQRGTMGQC